MQTRKLSFAASTIAVLGAVCAAHASQDNPPAKPQKTGFYPRQVE
ncbi:MAG TPA: hypothetical protein VN815_10650 [Steroidobacteraceae bacterium]|jgi:hypothetical protein|nr:hypothetical protein [Steroidobacteraceae bacterium]